MDHPKGPLSVHDVFSYLKRQADMAVAIIS